VGSQVGQQFGAAEGMQRAATGAMEPNIMTDMLTAIFGTTQGPTGQGNAAAGRPWKQ
jgi:hypothetical protein